uniref:Uncharacterized protein n=1 Tax=Knipowitschia caucasica TaxID=637954 RepID=A0AAV2L8Y7_KNICA
MEEGKNMADERHQLFTCDSCHGPCASVCAALSFTRGPSTDPRESSAGLTRVQPPSSPPRLSPYPAKCCSSPAPRGTPSRSSHMEMDVLVLDVLVLDVLVLDVLVLHCPLLAQTHNATYRA